MPIIFALIGLSAGCVPAPPTLRAAIQPTNTPVTAAPMLASSATPRPPTALPTLTPAPALPALIFESNRSGHYEIYAMNSDGTGLIALTDSASSGSEGSGSPDWSPDGQQIAFSSRYSGDWELYGLIDGAGHNLTSSAGEDDKADWSPDGSQLVFNSRRDNRRWADLFLMDADGSRLRPLTDDADDDREPVWSPGGDEIAYRSFRDGNYDLYALDLQSRAPRRLTKTDPPVWNASPAWSPDGSQIAFETDRDGNYEIYLMDTNGKSLRNLTQNEADDKEPAWSPDGRAIVFSSLRDGNFELYRLDLASGGVTRLTYDCGRDHNPDWRRGAPTVTGEPVPTAVAYVLSDLNLRSGAGTAYGQVSRAAVGDCLTVIGRSADDQWLQVRSLTVARAWVARALVDVQGNLALVPVST